VVVVCPNPNCLKSLSISSEQATAARRCPWCGTTIQMKGSTEQRSAGTLAGKSAVPDRIGPYQVSGELGRGAFGVVYQGFDAALKREVAIKVLNRGAIGSTRAVERFLREAQVVAGMHHNHIVGVYQLGEHEGGFYIGSRFIRGTTLADIIPEQGLPAARAVELMLQLLDALGYAHEQGVIHRDVKPDNALLDEKGQLHLTDFGLAGWVDGAQLTQEGTVLGTPSYMAPEQARGDVQHITAAADQYSAGVVLYEMLSGHRPFEGGSLPVLIHNVIHTPPPFLTEYRADLSLRLQGICLKALAKRPEDRFADCRAMAVALREWQTELAIPPVPDVPIVKERRSLLPSGGDDSLRRTHSSLAKQRTGEVPPPPRPGALLLPPSAPPARKRSREEMPLPVRPDSALPEALQGRWLWLAGAGAGLALMLLTVGLLALVFLGNRQTQVATTDRADALPDLRADIEECMKRIRSGQGSQVYVRRTAPGRIDVWRRAAQQGSAEGQWFLGRCLELGSGIAKNEEEAVKWYRKAAEQGYALAQNNLGISYGTGRVVDKDEKEAVQWYRKAADQGHADAQCNLGRMYENGHGVNKDEKEAVRWYRKAADQGHARAQLCLGLLYAYGRVVKDAKEAVKWYRKAAEQNVPRAQNNLGASYEGGLGVDRDEKEAVRWFRKAAELGDALAQRNLGRMYENGRGVNKDVTEAVRWYLKAADQGDKPAKAALKRLTGKMK
jgi:TPR repeat protein/serine/threonine protein kinase